MRSPKRNYKVQAIPSNGTDEPFAKKHWLAVTARVFSEFAVRSSSARNPRPRVDRIVIVDH